MFDGTAMIQSPTNRLLTYDWGNQVFGSFTFGRPSGIYQVRMFDWIDFEWYDQAEIGHTQSVQPLVHTDITPVGCNAVNNGSVKLTVSGGSPPFSFQWAHGPTTSDIYNLMEGHYECTIQQTNACDMIVSVWVHQESSPQIEFAIRDDRHVPSPRSAIVEAMGRRGLPPYSYQWSTGDTTPVISTLTPGKYEVTVTDAQGCEHTDEVQFRGAYIPENVYYPAEITHDCDGNGQGASQLILTGNSSSYSFQWAHGPTTSSIDQLQAGIYHLMLYDSSRDCAVPLSYHVRSLAPMNIQAYVKDVSCRGGSDGGIDLQVTGGNAVYKNIWSHGAEGDHLRELAPGSYSVQVMDSAGCSDSLTVQVGEPASSLQLAVSSTADQAPGRQGGAVATASGGWPPYRYEWDTRPIRYTDSLQNVPGGTYRVKVIDSKGCVKQQEILIDAWVGLEKFVEEAKVSIFPNPNGGICWLKVESEIPQEVIVTVLDVHGKELSTENYGRTSNLSHQLDLSTFSPSIYLLQIKVGERIYREKLLIER